MPFTEMNASCQPSEIYIHGEPGAVIRPEHDLGTSQVVLVVADGGPRVHLTGLTFVDGLAIRVDGSELTMENCVFDGSRTGQVGPDGGEQLIPRRRMLASSPPPASPPSSPPRPPDRALNVHGGYVHMLRSVFAQLEGGAIVVTERGALALDSCELRGNRADDGGAALIVGGSASFALSVFESNAASREGGALAVRAGAVILGDGTLFERNRAPTGRSISLTGGTLRYELPTPPARWVLIPDGSTISTLTFGTIESDFPFPCSAGVYAPTNDTLVQSGPMCGGPCPPGHFCSGSTTDPIPCPAGTYCPQVKRG